MKRKENKGTERKTKEQKGTEIASCLVVDT